MLVVDASACLHALAAQDGWSGLQSRDPIAPPLMWSEALSTLRRAVWRGAMTEELARWSRDQLLSAPVKRVLPEEMYGEAWRVAGQLGWAKTYDAEYVALARLMGCPLVTVDARLQRGAGRVVEVLGPDDL